MMKKRKDTLRIRLKVTENNEREKENTVLWVGSRENTEFLFSNNINVLLKDEKNEISDLRSHETPSVYILVFNLN